MIVKIFSTLASLIALVLPLIAQQPSGLRANLRLLSFDSGMKLKETYAHDPAAGTAAVLSPVKNYLNHEYSTVVLASRKVVFTTSKDRASLAKEGELVGEVTLPEGAKSAILLFLPAPSGSKTLCRIMAINDAKRVFPAGSFHSTNLSPFPFRITLENKNYDFKPSQVVLIENPPVSANKHSGMRAFAFKDNAWKPVATGMWPHPGESRGVKVIYQNPASGNLELRAFDDVPPREPVEDTVPTP